MLNSNQVRFIKENMGTMSTGDFSKKFKVHKNAIAGAISNIKRGNEWTPEQDDFIIKNKDKMTCNEMSKVIGKSLKTIFQRMTRLNIKKENFSKNTYIKKGQRLSIETGFKIGQEPKIKGKTYEEYYGKDKAKYIKSKIVNKRKGGEGYNPWNKNLTKETDERVRKYSEKTKELKNSKEWKETKGKEYSEKMKNGGALKARMANRLSPNKPEKLLTNLIEKNNLPFNYVGDGRFGLKERHSHSIQISCQRTLNIS